MSICSVCLLQFDEVALVLAGLAMPIVVAKVNANKYKKLRSRYGVE
jgi:protein disulfide-isomerase A1